jgi:surfactin synthase thioesterase subunit/glycosyltransferase involved in cell wall biosynthesis
MRVLLTANASYAPPRGGATRSNLVWLDHLARSGHQCRIVCGSPGEGAELQHHESIAVLAVEDPARRVETLRREIREFAPDWVLVSSEDLGHGLLREAHHSAPGRVVYLAHTPQFFPFGPASWNRDPQAAEIVRGAAGIVAIGRHMAGYVEEELGRRPSVIHPPIYKKPGNVVSVPRFCTMVNPCAVKGISIFLDLARRLAACRFAVVPGWGTTSDDRRALERLPNVAILPNARDIDEVLAQTRVLLMPSLWYEGFGLIAMEAMLRGIPVVASDSGGLKEAKQGTGFVIPVRTIESYEPVFDEHAMPMPVLPENDIAPWVEAIETLLVDPAAYERESSASRGAAERFVSGLDAAEMERFLTNLPRVRVLLAQNALYYPSYGGGDKSNRLLMEALAARGHECRVVARQPGPHFIRAGVDVRVAAQAPREFFSRELESFRPDVIVASTDDPAQLLLEPALRYGRAPVIYLARATIALPFGPDCAFPSEAKTARIRACARVVGVSEYVADYIRRYAAIDAVHVPISLVERADWPALGGFDNEFVAMANPCAVKGIAIFLALADAFPETAFAAVPTWGTNEQDRAALAARPNVRLLDPVDDIDELLRRCRVVVVPSLWAEARSRMVLEAMLRGVPVLAANVGGIPEAKMGVPYLLPVNPIRKYAPRVDEQMVPVAEVPAQDVGPWRDALARLLTDRAHYDEISRASRAAALSYAASLSVEPFERFLSDQRAAPSVPAPAPRPLTPERRLLLALRLRKKAGPSFWFPGADAVEGLRVFWFPHAGGAGPINKVLPSICPVRIRFDDAPFERFPSLIATLADGIERYVAEPFAFFGHSMGAVVAFELARMLRSRGKPQPKVLIASAARAPQFRRDYFPPPLPAEEQALHESMPGLKADVALYRTYVYAEGAPLDCPIRAYGGVDDSHIEREHLDGWREQTTASFSVRIFPGGHFYWQTCGAEFAAALVEDLS